MSNPNFSLADSNAIVTGASSGIGRAVAERFAAEGSNVTICSRTLANLKPVRTAINEREGSTAQAVECNVRNRDSVDRLVNAAVDRFGEPDILVNNAGGDFPSQFEDISPNGWKSVVDVNLHGTFHCTQAVADPMQASGGGAVVNVASMYGLSGARNHTHYSASKAGVINLTEVLAAEWAEHAIRVNAVAPGFVITPGLERAIEDIDAGSIRREVVDRQIGTPEEIADVVHFLASPAASYVTGITLPAKGVPDIETTEKRVQAAEAQIRD